MTLKNKIMDKFWIEFLIDEEGDSSTWKNSEQHFWYWFYLTKMKKIQPRSLEEFLK